MEGLCRSGYAGNRVTIDVLPWGPLTLLIIRSITIKQGIHTDGPENWTHNAMAQLVKQGNPSMMMTMMISLTLFQFLPRSGRSSCPCEGFIASASIGRTVPPHDSIGRPTNLECEGDDENGSGGHNLFDHFATNFQASKVSMLVRNRQGTSSRIHSYK